MLIVTLTSKINRVHPLIIVNMSAKFDEEAHNSLVSITFTRSTHGRAHTRNHSSVTISPTVDKTVPRIPGKGQISLQGGGARQHL